MKLPDHLLTVEDAGRKYYGLGRTASYNAAASGEMPTVRRGRRYLVPVRLVEKQLGLDQGAA